MHRAMVPSDVDIEDKIIGPFTLKQFIYLVIGAMAVFIIYTLFKNNILLVVVLSLPVVIIVLAFVFFKFNEQPFEQFLAAFIAFYSKPTKRLWQRDNTLEDIKRSEVVKKKGGQPPKTRRLTEEAFVSRIEELAYFLDTQTPQALSEESKKRSEVNNE